MYRPTTSRTFSTSCGSCDRRYDSVRCGRKPNARQIRPIVAWLNPKCFAIERVLQCVRPRGVVSRVFVTTSSILLSPIIRGAPGRGSSYRPSTRSLTKRSRHFPTVTLLVCSNRATSVFVSSSAQRSTIFARKDT